jgi:hypothetical protein
MQLSLTNSSAFLAKSRDVKWGPSLRLKFCPNAEEGRNYVSTHGFSEIMCLHLWRRIDRWRRDEGGRYAPRASSESGQEKA